MKTDCLKSKAVVSVLTCLTLLLATKASAEPDFSGLRKATTNFFAVMDRLVEEVPKATNADNAAKVIESWATANDSAADAGETFLQNNPAIAAQSKPPPEFVDCFSLCTMLRTNYASVTGGVGTLIKQFGAHPKVAAAVHRFQRSVERLDRLVKLGVKNDD